jgi:hypothetical protein
VGARHQRAAKEREQQVTRPAEEPVGDELGMALGVQLVEQRPDGEIEPEERRELIEADRKARRPAPAQREQREPAA